MSQIKITEEIYLELIGKENKLNNLTRRIDGLILNYAILKTGSDQSDVLKAEMQFIIKDYDFEF
jgi:hypothetical protein